MKTYGFLSLFVLVVCAYIGLSGGADVAHCPGVAKRTGYYLDVFRNRCYLFVGHERHWDEAQKHCWGMGGELVSIKDMETMNYIKEKLYSSDLGWSNNGVWNGASDLRKVGWEWTTGEKLDFTYWADGEPSKLFGFLSVENCACMRRSDGWRWHDYHCHAPGIEYKYICQFDMMHHPGKSEHISGSGGTPVTVRDDTAAVIGLAVGAVLLLLLLSIALYVLYKKHERQKALYRDPTVRLQNTGYATIITHHETATQESDSDTPSVNNARPVSNVYLDPVEIGRVYEEVPKDSDRVANRYGSGEVEETARLVYNGAAASAEDDGGYMSATTSEASGATSGYCSGNTGKKVDNGDYIEMNGATGVGPVRESNIYVEPKLQCETPKKSAKPTSQEDIHIYTNQLDESGLDEVGYLRPLPPVPCGIQSSPTKKV